MSILSSGFYNKSDLKAIIKFSNYNVFYNSDRNYESNYYSLVNLLHEFKPVYLNHDNNGFWVLKISSINIDSFNNYFIHAWGDRSNHYKKHISIDIISNAIKYIKINKQLSLICSNSIEYLKNFIKEVFNNQNPWPTLIYFSKFISTFLPDLGIPFDTASLKKIARDYKIKINGNTYNVDNYISIHSGIKKDIIDFLNNNSMSVVDLKKLDDFSLIKQKQIFVLNQTPLNRPIDKIYYSV
jgi:hypothetical protein